MASHRRVVRWPVPLTARTAATVAMASAASVTVLGQPGHAADVTGPQRRELRQIRTPADGSLDALSAALAGGGGARAVSPRAARAVRFAQAAIGSPYGWGATGPHAYDCSGLAQAAWRAAGVALPRTTYAQAGAGRGVPGDQLLPGDLVFFHPGFSHVGICVGDGRMIHMPRPGGTVQLATIDSLPFAAATRPA